jgi:transcriptional regulator with XRE-family HTH domain
MTRHATPNLFGQLLRAFREEKGLKAKDMAEQLGVSESYLYKCETRQIPSLVLIKMIVNTYSLKRKQERSLLWAVYQDSIAEAVRRSTSNSVQIVRPSRWARTHNETN